MSPTATFLIDHAPGVPAGAGEPQMAGTAAEGLILIVAPSNGRFQPRLNEGAISAGTLVAHVTGGRGRADEVRSPTDGVVLGLLARPGQLVTRGQALAWARADLGEPAP